MADKPTAKKRRPAKKAGAAETNGYHALNTRSDSCAFGTLTPEPVEWLVPGLIPAADVVMVAGETGAGKSTFFTTLAAQVSTGRPIVGGDPQPPGRALLYCREENHRGPVLGRLVAAGADVGRVIAGDLRADGQLRKPLMLPDGLAELADRITGLGARLCVLDPLVGYFNPGIGPLDGQAVRTVLEGLQAVARATGCTICTVAHLRKSRAGSVHDWISGSKEWANVPRFTLTFGRDPRDQAVSVLALTKSPVGAAQASRRYTLEDCEGAKVFRLGGMAGVDVADLGAQPDDAVTRSARSQCKAYLRAILQDGDVEQKKIMGEAAAIGLSTSTMRRAMLDLGVTAHFVGGYGEQRWVWRKPEAWPE